MKTRIRHYSKSAFAILLALCMIFSCVIQSGAARVSNQPVGADSSRTFFIGIPNSWDRKTEWSFGLYTSSSATSATASVNGSNALLVDENHEYWGENFDIYAVNISNTTAKYCDITRDSNTYCNGGNNRETIGSNNFIRFGWRWTAMYTYTLGDSVNISKSTSSDVYVNDSVTLTPSLTNSTYNALDSTSYSVKWDNASGSDCTSGTDYTISSNTFIPKKRGTFYIAASSEFHTKGFSNLTGTAVGNTTVTAKGYYVASADSNNNPAFSTNAWATDDADALMTNTYSVTFNNISAGTYYYKVTHGTWDTTYPNENKSITVPHTGDSVTITYNDSTHQVSDLVSHRSYSVSLNTDGGTINAGDITSYTCGTGATLPTNVTKSGYTFDGWYTSASGGSKVTSISSTETGNKIYYAHWTVAKEQLSAPTNVKLNNTAGDVTLTATTVGAKVLLTWDTVTNAGSYEVYKGTTKVATVSTNSYSIERAYSSTGTYSVVAVPSDTTNYSSSPKSTGRKLTVNKKKLTAPTVTVTPTAIALGSSVDLTATDANSGVTASQYNLYYYESSLAVSNDYKLTSGTAKTITPSTAGSHTYKVVAYPVDGTNNDYYTQSDATSASTVTVSSPSWYLIGDLVDSTTNKWQTSLKDYPVDEFVSANVFKRTVTYASGGENEKHYFRLNSGSNQYTVTDGSDTDMSTHSTSATAVTASTQTENGAMYVKGQGTFTIYVNQATSGSPKVWIEKTEAQKYTTIVYVNQDSGATNMYVWKDANNEVSAWPGEFITGTTETVNDIPYYKYTFESYWDHFDIVVNKGNGQNQSADLKGILASKTYYVIWDGGDKTAASISETAPVIQLGYKEQNTSSDSHADFTNRTVSVTLAANTTYEFWLKSANSHLNDMNSGTMTRGHSTGWSFPVNNTNTKIVADLAGTYTFTYTVSNGTISVSVTYPPEPKYNVTVNQGNHGTVKVNGNSFTTGGTIQVGPLTTASIQAVAASGYHFTGWTTTGGVAAVSGYTTSSNPITISASATGSITANYEEDSYTVTLASAGNGSITAPSSKTLTAHPITATSLSGVTVSPANGYKFNGWTAGTGVTLTGGSNTSASTGTIKATRNATLTANFTKVSYSLTGKTALDGTVDNYGTVSFYSNEACTTAIITAKIGDTVYAKFASTDYALVNFTLSGTGASAVSTTGNVYKFTMGYANATVTANVRRLASVMYYVDMHNNSMSGKSVEVAIVSNGSGTTVLMDGEGKDCKKNLEQQGSSTVYAASVPTPATKKNSSEYNQIYIKISYSGQTAKIINLPSGEVTALMNSTSPEVWLEAQNEAGNTYKVAYATNTSLAVKSGKKRIYVAKPNSWQDDEPSWKNLRLYHWGDYGDIGWSTTPTMTCIGYDSNYHYYYVDIDSGINNIIFQGWKDNSNYPDVQTGNIENIGSSNYFILSKDGGSYVGTKGENATPPGYTRYVNRVDMNVRDTANITPTHTGAKVTYSVPEGETRVTVGQDGSITANATTLNGVTDNPVTITVKVFGSVGAKATGNDAGDIGDVMTYTVTVSVRNPGIFSGFKVMSFAHQEYTVKIPEVSGDQPGYFVLDNKKTSVVVNGLYDGSGYTAKYSNSAIIKPMGTVDVENVGEDLPTSFTVKYAASNASKGYSNITLNDAMVTTVSIKKTGAKRFGFKEWTPSQASITTSKVINNGVETVTHKGLAFAGTATYQAIFEEYDYVDVTFNFEYDEYVPQQVTEYEEINGVQTPVRTITDYQYDSTWAAQAGAHTTKKYTVSGFEVRNLTTDSQKAAGATKLISGENLVIPAVAAIEALPSNDYYNYKIESSGITINSTGDYVATVTVVMTKSERTYSVYLNGAKIGSNYTYQAYADLNTGNTVSKWYAVKDNAAINAQSPLLATGTGYKFRVKGDTYLRTQEGTLDNDSFNRSENGFANYEITHRQSGSAMKEYLLQNFYIADFFDQDKVKDLERGDGSKADEANFVGGGVVYYSVTDNQPYSKAVDAGYVNAGDGTAVASEIKTMLKRNIEANYEDLAAAVGEEEAMKVVYGQAIPVTNNTENGAKTGVLYRYLPLENYTVDANNNITKELNSDVFRYSNSLQSYQYIYASGNENKATNSGKNMRLYSYYIYSYRTYDKDTNVPRLNYEVVLSDQYSDASTYWAGNSND